MEISKTLMPVSGFSSLRKTAPARTLSFGATSYADVFKRSAASEQNTQKLDESPKAEENIGTKEDLEKQLSEAKEAKRIAEKNIKTISEKINILDSEITDLNKKCAIEEKAKEKTTIDILKLKDKLNLFETPEEQEQEKKYFKEAKKRVVDPINNNIPVQLKDILTFSAYNNWTKIKERYGEEEEKPVISVSDYTKNIMSVLEHSAKLTTGKFYEVVGKTYEKPTFPLLTKDCLRLIIKDDNNQEIKISTLEFISLQKLPGKFDISENLSTAKTEYHNK